MKALLITLIFLCYFQEALSIKVKINTGRPRAHQEKHASKPNLPSLKKFTGITNDHHTGRLGDQLVLFTYCLYHSYNNNQTFFFRPFPLCEQLILSTKLQPLPTDKPVMHVGYQYTQKADWHKIADNKEFIRLLKTYIQPVHNIDASFIPKDAISIAVHIRKGGGYDQPLLSRQEPNLTPAPRDNDIPYADLYEPLKFLPTYYYIDQLMNLILHINDDIPVYVHIFTDYQQPQELVDTFKKYLPNPNITFGCRQENSHCTNIIEDFFLMTYYFDCLIRGGSNFSIMSDLIGNHKLVIRPCKAEWQGDKIIATKVAIIAHDEEFTRAIGIPYQVGNATFFPT